MMMQQAPMMVPVPVSAATALRATAGSKEEPADWLPDSGDGEAAACFQVCKLSACPQLRLLLLIAAVGIIQRQWTHCSWLSVSRAGLRLQIS
jgi:hypothetical protein